MIDPDRVVGTWRIRVWGLILNFAANAAALVGVVRFVERGAWGLMAAGAVLTVACIGVLSIPSRASPR